MHGRPAAGEPRRRGHEHLGHPVLEAYRVHLHSAGHRGDPLAAHQRAGQIERRALEDLVESEVAALGGRGPQIRVDVDATRAVRELITGDVPGVEA